MSTDPAAVPTIGPLARGPVGGDLTATTTPRDAEGHVGPARAGAPIPGPSAGRDPAGAGGTPGGSPTTTGAPYSRLPQAGPLIHDTVVADATDLLRRLPQPPATPDQEALIFAALAETAETARATTPDAPAPGSRPTPGSGPATARALGVPAGAEAAR